MYCARCGESNPRAAADCVTCGNPIGPPPGVGTPNGHPCPICMAVNAPNALFCAACGARVIPVEKLTEADLEFIRDPAAHARGTGDGRRETGEQSLMEQEPEAEPQPAAPAEDVPDWLAQLRRSIAEREALATNAPADAPRSTRLRSRVIDEQEAPALAEQYAEHGLVPELEAVPEPGDAQATPEAMAPGSTGLATLEGLKVEVSEPPAEAESAPPAVEAEPVAVSDAAKATLQELPPHEPATVSPPISLADRLPSWLRRRPTVPLEPEPAAPFEVLPPAPPAPMPIETAPGEIPAWQRALGVEIGETMQGSPGGTNGHVAPTRIINARPPRPGSVEVFERLLAPVEPPAVAAPAHRAITARIKSDQIFHLLLIGVVVVVWLLHPFDTGSLTPDGSQPSEGKAFYDSLNKLPPNKPVLLVYDWDASRYGEMYELSRAVTHYFASRGRAFATISTLPEGTGFAVATTEEVMTGAVGVACGSGTAAWPDRAYGQSYLHLGYRAGSEAGLADFVGAAALADVQPYDALCYHQTRYAPMLNGTPSVKQFAAILLLAGEQQPLRLWVEQAGTQMSIPILAALPESGRPSALPYAAGKQPRIESAVYGVAGARDFEAQLDSAKGSGAAGASDLSDMGRRLGTESAALLTLVLAMLLGFIGGAYRWLSRRSGP